jgi:hypothetical protein
VIRNLTKEEYDSEKIRIITLMYNPFSPANGDEYIAGQQVAKDKLKNRIDYQLFQNFVPSGADLQQDVYQMVFENLLKMNEKQSKRFVDGYYKNPNSVWYFAFYLLKIKGFAVDPNYPDRPSHSLAKSIMYASSFNQFNSEFSYKSEEDDEIEYINDG